VAVYKLPNQNMSGRTYGYWDLVHKVLKVGK
jgi:hypothetical protein